eukprot:5126535-Pyramimonas_sp.AAC.1
MCIRDRSNARTPRAQSGAGSRICGVGQPATKPGPRQFLRSARSSWRWRPSTFDQLRNTMCGRFIRSFFIGGWGRSRTR